VLGRYAIERFLYRLGRSPYRDKFCRQGSHTLYAVDPATLTGPQRTWIYSGAAHLLPSQKLK
jgi:hypothetical protein